MGGEGRDASFVQSWTLEESSAPRPVRLEMARGGEGRKDKMTNEM